MYANKTRLTVRQREPTTSSGVNVCTARFEFSLDWDGLTRTAVFKAGAVSRSVLLDESNTCEVPWEVPGAHGIQLQAGVCGTWGGEEVLPTIWGVLIWFGAVDATPSGWVLCDGENGTPDLRDRFVLGAENRNVGETGGSEEAALTVAQIPSHSHKLAMSTGYGPGAFIGRGNGSLKDNSSSSMVSAGDNKPHPNMPPYYTLCYIMKL